MNVQKEIQHLFNRAGFGLSPKEIQSGAFPNRQTALDYLFAYNTTPRPLAADYPLPLKDERMTDKEKGNNGENNEE